MRNIFGYIILCLLITLSFFVLSGCGDKVKEQVIYPVNSDMSYANAETRIQDATLPNITADDASLLRARERDNADRSVRTPARQRNDPGPTDAPSDDPAGSPTSCGDGILDAGEACDDKNTNNGDWCSSDCLTKTCFEQDSGRDYFTRAYGYGHMVFVTGQDPIGTKKLDHCRSTTILNEYYCEDYILKEDRHTCSYGCLGGVCLPPVCGDGTAQEGEACDDGNTLNGDGCSSSCAVEVAVARCGDGQIDAGEQCDDGNENNGDGCSTSCTVEAATARCGDSNLDLGEQCDDGNENNGDGCSALCRREFPSTGEFQVNQYTDDNQLDAKVVMANDGNFLVVWASAGQDGSAYGIYARRYNASANPVGDEFRVNTMTQAAQEQPDVAITDDGRFVVVWVESATVPSDTYDIYAKRLDSLGNPIGDEFKVNQNTLDEQHDPSIAANKDGNFVVVWKSIPNSDDVIGRRFDKNGNSLGNDFLVTDFTDYIQRDPDVAMADDGSFVVVWEDYWRDGDGGGIFAKRFDNQGNPIGTDFQINQFTFSSQNSPAIAMMGDGQFVVVWRSDTQDDRGGYGIVGRRYTADGTPLGDEFLVNTYVLSNQVAPDVDLRADGAFVVAWQSKNQDGSDNGVYGQYFNAAGEKVGEEFRINEVTNDRQGDPDVAVGPSGNFVVAWQSYLQDGSYDGVFARVYPPVRDIDVVLCGDRLVQDGEQCDDGNTQDGDGCSLSCRNEFCGDSVIQIGIGEECDDGNIVNSDGCSASCAAEFKPSGEFQIMVSNPSRITDFSMLQTEAGIFAVWAQDNLDINRSDIYAQSFDSAGNPLQSSFRVNTYRTNDQARPSAAKDGSNYVISWSSFGQDGSGWGIFANRYTPSGLALTTEFPLNLNSVGNQDNSSLIPSQNGTILAAWIDDNGGRQVMARRLMR